MPARYVICPVITTIDDEGEPHSRPKVMMIADPGRPLLTNPNTGEIISHYVFAAIIGVSAGGQVGSECLCLVAGHDMSALDADPEIVTLFEGPDRPLPQVRGLLDQTPGEILTTPQRKKLERMLKNKGLDITDLTRNDPCWKWASRYCEALVGRPKDIRLLKTVLVNESV